MLVSLHRHVSHCVDVTQRNTAMTAGAATNGLQHHAGLFSNQTLKKNYKENLILTFKYYDNSLSLKF